jgi:hypothetical protein
MRTLIFLCLLTLFSSCRENQRAIVVSKVQKASKLATAEFVVDKAIFARREKSFLHVIKLNEAVFLAHSQATIKAGIDLEKLTPDDITISEQLIKLKLPPVQVINFSYPIEKFTIDEQVTEQAFLNSFTLEDYDELFQQAELDIRQNLQYLGIVKTTREKTRLLLVSLLKNLGYQEVYIEFKDGVLIPPVQTEKEVAP